MRTSGPRSDRGGDGRPTADGIRLHLFECGRLDCAAEKITLNEGHGGRLDIPVPWYLIEHPRGLALIDGGNAPQCAVDPTGHWGSAAEDFFPSMTAGEACVPALRRAGFDPLDVRYILQSHLHLDHTGALASFAEFANAEVIATRRELEYARSPDWFAAPGYIPADFEGAGIAWSLLDDEDGYDVFGDGSVLCWHTPGHSPGHQSFEVRLPETGSVLLTIDAAYTLEHWADRALPGVSTSLTETAHSVRKLRRLARRREAMVITGHDPRAWPALRKTPHPYR